jgi:hypothetical protein
LKFFSQKELKMGRVVLSPHAKVARPTPVFKEKPIHTGHFLDFPKCSFVFKMISQLARKLP